MDRAFRIVALGVVAGGLAWAGEARGQGVARQTPAAPTPAQMYANPYLNPYANPYLNPAMSVGSTDRTTTLMYFMAAQQARQRGAEAAALEARRSSPAAAVPYESMTPASGADRYFHRGSSGGAEPARSYFQRHNGYFLNNGR